MPSAEKVLILNGLGCSNCAGKIESETKKFRVLRYQESFSKRR
ncbi:hypothetical protein UF75_5429 [Desulfosporosinus sp. I2]|nr:hypothetical protein UF75_5429 [Desulfosporosinus sp. I2]